jgi:glycogen operon protein
MADEDWHRSHTNSFAVFMNGDALLEVDDDGRPIHDGSFLLLFNAHHEALQFTLPAASFGRRWRVLIDTAQGLDLQPRSFDASTSVEVPDRSMLVLFRQSVAMP